MDSFNSQLQQYLDTWRGRYARSRLRLWSRVVEWSLHWRCVAGGKQVTLGLLRGEVEQAKQLLAKTQEETKQEETKQEVKQEVQERRRS
jgi:hypothetical protein